MERDDYTNWNNSSLAAELNARGLKVTGEREEWVARLVISDEIALRCPNCGRPEWGHWHQALDQLDAIEEEKKERAGL